MYVYVDKTTVPHKICNMFELMSGNVCELTLPFGLNIWDTGLPFFLILLVFLQKAYGIDSLSLLRLWNSYGFNVVYV